MTASNSTSSEFSQQVDQARCGDCGGWHPYIKNCPRVKIRIVERTKTPQVITVTSKVEYFEGISELLHAETVFTLEEAEKLLEEETPS